MVKTVVVPVLSLALLVGVVGVVPMIAGPKKGVEGLEGRPVIEHHVEKPEKLDKQGGKSFERGGRGFGEVKSDRKEVNFTERQEKIDAFMDSLSDVQLELFKGIMGNFEKPELDGRAEKSAGKQRRGFGVQREESGRTFNMPIIVPDQVPYMPNVEVENMPRMPKVQSGIYPNLPEGNGERPEKTQHFERFGAEVGRFERGQLPEGFNGLELESIKEKVNTFKESLTEEQKAIYEDLFGSPRQTTKNKADCCQVQDAQVLPECCVKKAACCK